MGQVFSDPASLYGAGVDRFLEAMSGLDRDTTLLNPVLSHAYHRVPNPNGDRFHRAYLQAPDIAPSALDLARDRVMIGKMADLLPEQSDAMNTALKGMIPWRKGPFDVFGIDLDAEWRSDLKWNRIASYLPSQKWKRVLDIGCNNGYYMARMAALNPEIVIGVDPYLLYYYQFQLLQRYMNHPALHCLLLEFEELVGLDGFFDTILCLGILYHERNPLGMLRRLRELLSSQGQLVLETIIIPGDDSTALFPERRYAQMRNVYFLPTLPCLINWLKRAGFRHIEVLSTELTTHDEQRRTLFGPPQSLESFLNPNDPTLTVEGYPAPIRACLSISI